MDINLSVRRTIPAALVLSFLFRKIYLKPFTQYRFVESPVVLHNKTSIDSKSIYNVIEYYFE